MISLDIENGYLKIGELLITPGLELQDIERLKQQHEVVDAVKNPPHRSYRMPALDDGYAAAGLYFYDDKITKVRFCLGKKFNFTPFEITTREIVLVKELLAELGGEKSYKWGKIDYYEDYRSGSVGLSLSYFSNPSQ